MSLGDSIRQTASIARWVSVAVTATDQTIRPAVQAEDRAGRPVATSSALAAGLCAQSLLLLPQLRA